MQWERGMMPTMETTEHLALQLDLRVDAAPGGGAFKATIALQEIDLSVEAVAVDLTEAMQSAAKRCAERLGELGYPVTCADVLGALEETLEPFDTGAAGAYLQN
jgi:hypothetical protein